MLKFGGHIFSTFDWRMSSTGLMGISNVRCATCLPNELKYVGDAGVIVKLELFELHATSDHTDLL